MFMVVFGHQRHACGPCGIRARWMYKVPNSKNDPTFYEMFVRTPHASTATTTAIMVGLQPSFESGLVFLSKVN